MFRIRKKEKKKPEKNKTSFSNVRVGHRNTIEIETLGDVISYPRTIDNYSVSAL